MKKRLKLFTVWTWIAYVFGGLLVSVIIYCSIGTLVSTTAADWLSVLPIGFATAYSAFRMRNNKKASDYSVSTQQDNSVEPRD
jgi:hypothetical protein